jgi:hypothetical protein
MKPICTLSILGWSRSIPNAHRPTTRTNRCAVYIDTRRNEQIQGDAKSEVGVGRGPGVRNGVATGVGTGVAPPMPPGSGAEHPAPARSTAAVTTQPTERITQKYAF